jgi:hypothetical protein
MISVDTDNRVYSLHTKYGSDLQSMQQSSPTLVPWSSIVADSSGNGVMFKANQLGYYQVILKYTNTKNETKVVGNTPQDIYTEIIKIEKEYKKVQLSYEYSLTTADNSTPNSNTAYFNKYSYIIFLSNIDILSKIADGTYLLSIEEPGKVPLIVQSQTLNEFVNDQEDGYVRSKLEEDSNFLGPIDINGEQKFRNIVNWSKLVKHYKNRDGFQLPPVGSFVFKLYNSNYTSNSINQQLDLPNREIWQTNSKLNYQTPSLTIGYKDIKILFEEIQPLGQDQVKCNLYFEKDSLSGNPFYLVFQSLRHIFLEDEENWIRAPGHCWRLNKAYDHEEWFLKDDNDTSPFLNVNPKDTSAYKKCYKFNYVGEIEKLGDISGQSAEDVSRVFQFRDVYNKQINVEITNKVVTDATLESNLVAWNSTQLQIEKQDTIVDPVIQNATLGQNNVDFFKLHIEFAARFIFNQNVNVKQLFDRSIEITHYLDPQNPQVKRLDNNQIQEDQTFAAGPSLKIGHQDLVTLNDDVLKSWLIGIKNNESKTFNLTMTLRYSYISGFGDARKTIAINRVFEKSFSYIVRKNIDGFSAEIVEQQTSLNGVTSRKVAIGLASLVALAYLANKANKLRLK